MREKLHNHMIADCFISTVRSPKTEKCVMIRAKRQRSASTYAPDTGDLFGDTVLEGGGELFLGEALLERV